MINMRNRAVIIGDSPFKCVPKVRPVCEFIISRG
jgi:hypothetical protein